MDAIVVGSGPNGLAAAITLAEAGCRVRVLEAEGSAGGGARSAGLTLPGFLHDRCSAIHPLAVGSPFLRGLPLAGHGLEWVHSPIPLAHPLDNGRAVLLRRSVEETALGLGRDGRAYARLFAPLTGHWEALLEEFLQPLLHIPRHPLLMARFALRAMRSANSLAGQEFRDDEARALFAGLAAHSFLPLDAPGAAAFALMLGMLGHAVGWPLPRGGAQSLSDALVAHLRSLGGVVETSRRVTSLDELPDVSMVLLDLSAWGAARVCGDRLPSRLQKRLVSFPHGPSVFKVDYALDHPIPWAANECRLAATVHLGGTLEEIGRAEGEVARGIAPARPFVLLAQPTLFDISRAPAGQHVAWAYCHLPRGCAADMTTVIEDQIERFAPGFRQSVLARAIAGPRDLEASNANLDAGNITGGACDLWHLISRPTLSPAPYRLAGTKYHLCSSSTPPGGGVHGMCGYHAARCALRSAH